MHHLLPSEKPTILNYCCQWFMPACLMKHHNILPRCTKLEVEWVAIPWFQSDKILRARDGSCMTSVFFNWNKEHNCTYSSIQTRFAAGQSMIPRVMEVNILQNVVTQANCQLLKINDVIFVLINLNFLKFSIIELWKTWFAFITSTIFSWGNVYAGQVFALQENKLRQ